MTFYYKICKVIDFFLWMLLIILSIHLLINNTLSISETILLIFNTSMGNILCNRKIRNIIKIFTILLTTIIWYVLFININISLQYCYDYDISVIPYNTNLLYILSMIGMMFSIYQQWMIFYSSLLKIQSLYRNLLFCVCIILFFIVCIIIYQIALFLSKSDLFLFVNCVIYYTPLIHCTLLFVLGALFFLK